MNTKQYSIKDIQDCILSIAKEFDSFCREHGITYYLMGGSALGAMRHKGFIPWDDDLDVFMTVENYKKFLKLFKEKGDKKYFLQEENTPEFPLFLSRVCLNGTTMVSDEFKYNYKQHHNVFIDIMCLYSVPNSMPLRLIQYVASQLLRVNALALSNFSQDSKLKDLTMLLSKVLVNKYTRPLLVRLVHSFEDKSTTFVGHFFGRARYPRTNFLREYIGDETPRYVDFEDFKMPVFQHVESYLEARFGKKWMEMPSQKTRDQYKVHSNFVDLEKDYTEYMNKDKTKWLYE